MIIIQPQDFVFSKIKAPKEMLYEISDNYCFYVPGYKHMPKYKSGQWDGKIRLFNLKTRLFYNGLLPDLIIEFCNRYDYTAKIEGNKQFLKPTLPLPDDFDWGQYTHFTPKSYQVQYLNEFFKFNRGLIHSPTGSGKSLIIFLAIQYILEQTNGKVLILVTQTNLAEQMASDFREYTSDDLSIQTIHSGRSKETDASINIATWQSVYKMPKSFFDEFTFLVCDEAHHATATSITSIINQSGNIPFIMGLTGTLDETKYHSLDLTAKFGKIIRLVKTGDLVKSKDLSPVEIDFLRLIYPANETEPFKKKRSYDTEIDFLINHQKRNEAIIEEALNQGENTLILFNFVDKHGKKLYEQMREICLQNAKNLFYISGETSVDDRETIRTILEKTIYWYEFQLEDGTVLRIPENVKIKLKDDFRGIENWKYPAKINSQDEIDDHWLRGNQYLGNCQ